MNIGKKNSEGHIDMTSYQALTNIICNKAADKKVALFLFSAKIQILARARARCENMPIDFQT